MSSTKVWFEEKRRIRQYETITVGYERTINEATENPETAFNVVKATVFKWMKQSLEEAQRPGG